jgi:hypothetical protein
MSSPRAVRYRKLALAVKVKADANLLLKLAEEMRSGAFSAWLNASSQRGRYVVTFLRRSGNSVYESLR